MNKRIIAPALMIAALSIVAVGTTYALFTDKSETNIAITSGKVDLKAKMSELKLYSASLVPSDPSDPIVPYGDTLGPYSGTYYYVQQTNPYFINHGTGVINAAGDTLLLDEVAPGDKAVTTFTLTNNSTIDIRYRIVAECTSTSDADLRFFSNLVFSGFGESLTSVSKYVSDWFLWKESDPNTKTEEISIALPLNLLNTYQESETGIKFTVETVQSNANVQGDAQKYFLEFTDTNVEEDELDPSKLKDLTLEVGEVEVSPSVTVPKVVVDVPASQGGVKADGTEISEGDVLTLKVKEEDAGDHTLQIIAQDASAAQVTDYEVSNYEVTVVDQNSKKIASVNEPMLVRLFVGLDKEAFIFGVYHKGSTVQKVASMAELVKKEQYYYNPLDGYIYILAEDFSPFTAAFSIMPQEANVTKVPAKVIQGQTVDCLFNFQTFKDADEVYQMAEKYYHADFVVSFDKYVPATTSTVVDDGGVCLLGHYDAYTAAKNIDFETVGIPEMEAGQEIRLMNMMDVSVNYLELSLFGYKNYECLEKAINGEVVYEHEQAMIDLLRPYYNTTTHDFDYQDPTMFKLPGFTAGAFASFNGGVLATYDSLTMNVMLRLYETTDQPFNQETGKYFDVSMVSYTFTNPNIA